MLQASFTMFDALGVSQHHDAVTGTGKQAVANDYALRMYKAFEKSNVEYASIVEEAANGALGLDADSQWKWCFKDNSTYLDCPIADYENE